MTLPTIDDVVAAHRAIAPYVHRTPVQTSTTLNARCGGQIFFKCEQLQRVGAFKFRGATNAVLALPEASASKGVVTHSSGNHAQAVARAAKERGIPAYIVMPENAPGVKRRAVAGYGAHITLCPPTLAAREAACGRLQTETGATLIHPYDDARVIAGQGTAARELCQQVPELDLLLAPVGGGGLLSGTGLVGRSLKIRVIGVEPCGADDAARSLACGQRLPSVAPDTIADGLLTSLGALTFPLIQATVEAIVTVDDDAIRRALRWLWERCKLVVEPSAAVPLAGILEGEVAVEGLRVGVILSGGNVDLDRLPFGRP